jgi:hypothetical protein
LKDVTATEPGAEREPAPSAEREPAVDAAREPDAAALDDDAPAPSLEARELTVDDARASALDTARAPSIEPTAPTCDGEDAAPSIGRGVGRRSEMLATLAIVGAFVVAVVARPILRRVATHPTRGQCSKMLDRYAEEEARAANPERADNGGNLDDAPARDLAAATIDRCVRDLTEDDVLCALRSNGADELERCLPP